MNEEKHRQTPLDISTPPVGKRVFSQETVDALKELGEVLRPIYRRLQAEGRIKRNDTAGDGKN